MQEAETLSLSASPAVWRRACTACTGAKRKCSKQVPTCRRCDQRGLQCLYPPARALEGGAPWSAGVVSYDDVFTFPIARISQHLESSPTWHANAPLQSPNSSTQEQVHSQVAHWFLAHASWEIAHLPPQPIPELFGEETLSTFVSTIQDWLRLWVTNDHCPLIHRYLYRVHMPKWVQDAYSTISVHLYKTPATDATVRRIIEHRLHQLIEENTVESTLEPGSTTLMDHLARVQALLVLLIICLFDGNIRLRAQGELHLATLLIWNDQMWQESTRAMRRDATMEPWRLWILSESLRRTWLTTSIIHGVYTTITQGYTCCPGGVYCTFGNGLWDATTAYDWERRSDSAKKRFFMQSLDVTELLLQEDPGVVDEFGNAIMLISSGVDKVQRWTASKGAPTDS